MIIILILIFLIIALFLSGIRGGKWSFWNKVVRTIITISAAAYFTFWFVERSVSQFLENSLAVQVINYLPQPIDFYIIRIQDQVPEYQKFSSKHVGQIRPEYFRIEYLNMQKSNEFWVVGYLGKGNLVYFSQVAVPNKNEDKIIEVRNYINHSLKLSAIATEKVAELKYENIKLSIWVTLDLLLIFLNAVLLFRSNKKK
ncbi:hypothetical protein [Epilithonimonas lactis]|mgnify:CR=1 FL=1|uniref:Uncharacterized protein n=1 Tax=Epilithonimonas lactis TaxID=421072 RepID=A0A085BF97_9FLAO|nr:hypothetical protein [Epilithonimonas lactis]KFC21142.1 hypothetical protein IO89_13090 [Epilithonimonas lactis]SEP74603.1 hypothetical protein SAMN04488097_0514 [Epilithonimonas lactis]